MHHVGIIDAENGIGSHIKTLLNKHGLVPRLALRWAAVCSNIKSK